MKNTTENCWKCNGSGQYRSFGVCFSCKGTGQLKRLALTLNVPSAPVVKFDCVNGQHEWLLNPAGKSCGQCGEKVYNP